MLPDRFARRLASGITLTLFALLTGIIAAGGALARVPAERQAEGPARPLDTVTPTATSTPDPCTAAWSVVSSPNVGTSYNGLSGIAVVPGGSEDAWAVGAYHSGGSPGVNHTLVMRWGGTAWSVVSSPIVGAGNNFLNGVAVVSANDIWAVGYYEDPSIDRTLILHWNGTAWSVIPSPNIGTSDNLLNGVAVASANDVWAVGQYLVQGSENPQTLTLHWDGASWSVVPSPNVGAVGTNAHFLKSVAVASANDIWAVGHYLIPSSGATRTLVLHWNGTAWSIAPSPNVAARDSALNSVAALSANEVWAVGNYTEINPVRYQTLTMRWDGVQWNIVPSPNVGSSYNRLDSVAAVSTNEVWAAGSYSIDATSRTLVEQWDGTSWSVVSSPNVGTLDNMLNGIAAVSSNEVWTAGFYRANVSQTLVERFTSPCPPAPTPTATPQPSYLVGHVIWEDRGTQPDPRQAMPITLTLKSAGIEVNFPRQTTDTGGFFTVNVSALPNDVYTFRVKGPHAGPEGNTTPGFLAVTGTVTLAGAPHVQADLGLQPGGDANNDNLVDVVDFNIIKVMFGQPSPVPDARADFTGDGLVDVSDFNTLNRNFGRPAPGPVVRGQSLVANSRQPAPARIRPQ